ITAIIPESAAYEVVRVSRPEPSRASNALTMRLRKAFRSSRGSSRSASGHAGSHPRTTSIAGAAKRTAASSRHSSRIAWTFVGARWSSGGRPNAVISATTSARCSTPAAILPASSRPSVSPARPRRWSRWRAYRRRPGRPGARHRHEAPALELEDDAALSLGRLDRGLGDRIEHALHDPGRGERLTDRQEPLAVARPSSRGERALDLRAKLVAHERLRQIVEGATPDRLHGVVDRAMGGHDEHRQAALLRVERLHELHPVHRSHAQIDEREIESLRSGGLQRAARLTHRGDVEAHRSQAHRQHLEDRRVVVDNENLPRHCSGVRGAGAIGGWPETRCDAAPFPISLRIPPGVRGAGPIGGWPETRCDAAPFPMSLRIPPGVRGTEAAIGGWPETRCDAAPFAMSLRIPPAFRGAGPLGGLPETPRLTA